MSSIGPEDKSGQEGSQYEQTPINPDRQNIDPQEKAPEENGPIRISIIGLDDIPMSQEPRHEQAVISPGQQNIAHKEKRGATGANPEAKKALMYSVELHPSSAGIISPRLIMAIPAYSALQAERIARIKFNRTHNRKDDSFVDRRVLGERELTEEEERRFLNSRHPKKNKKGGDSPSKTEYWWDKN